MSPHEKGNQAEKALSTLCLELGVPLLVSPLILRAMNLGQVDMCYIDTTGTIIVVESKVGRFISKKQRRRLRQSCEFLSAIFKRPSQLYYSFSSQSSWKDI